MSQKLETQIIFCNPVLECGNILFPPCTDVALFHAYQATTGLLYADWLVTCDMNDLFEIRITVALETLQPCVACSLLILSH